MCVCVCVSALISAMRAIPVNCTIRCWFIHYRNKETEMKTRRKRKDKTGNISASSHTCTSSLLFRSLWPSFVFFCLFLFMSDRTLSYCMALWKTRQQKHMNLNWSDYLHSDDSGIWLMTWMGKLATSRHCTTKNRNNAARYILKLPY